MGKVGLGIHQKNKRKVLKYIFLIDYQKLCSEFKIELKRIKLLTEGLFFIYFPSDSLHERQRKQTSFTSSEKKKILFNFNLKDLK